LLNHLLFTKHGLELLIGVEKKLCSSKIGQGASYIHHSIVLTSLHGLQAILTKIVGLPNFHSPGKTLTPLEEN